MALRFVLAEKTLGDLSMLYFIQGSARDVFQDFKCESLIATSKVSETLIQRDLPRTCLLGGREAMRRHFAIWSKIYPTPNYYCQGDMSGGNLFKIYGEFPFQKKGESYEHASLNHVNITFAYVDEHQRLCGLNICYRRDDPSKWMVGLVKDTHLPPDERTVAVLTGVSPDAFLVERKKRTARIGKMRMSESILANTLLPAADSPLIAAIIKEIITPKGTINHHSDVLNLCTESVGDPEKDGFPENQTLLARLVTSPGSIINDPLLQKIALSHTNPAPHQILSCLDNTGSLCNTLQSVYKRMEDYGFQSRIIDLVFFLDKERQFDKFALFSEDNWSFPEDNFAQTVVCQLVLNQPEITIEQLQSLILLLKGSFHLKQFVNPYELADYLLRKKENDTVEPLATLTVLSDYFKDLLQKFKRIAQVRGKPLPPDILQDAGMRYLTEPDSDIPALLTLCENVEQTKAALVLLEQGYRDTNLALIVANPVLVAAINKLADLKLCLLIDSLFDDPFKLPVLAGLYRWPQPLDQTACLLLWIQGRLQADKFERLRHTLQEYPYLSRLLVNLHNKGYSPDFLEKVSQNPVLHQGLRVLDSCDIAFVEEHITAEAGVLLALIAQDIKGNEFQSPVKKYLATLLPLLMDYFNGETELSELSVGIETLDLNDENDTALCCETIKTTVVNYLGMIAEAKSIGFLELETVFVAPATCRFLAKAISKLAEHNDSSALDHDSKLVTDIKRQLFHEFASGAIDAGILDDVVLDNAVRALQTAYLDNREAAKHQTPYFRIFVTSQALASAVLLLSQHGLSTRELLQRDAESQRQGLQAIQYLKDMAQDNEDTVRLALAMDDKGHDFRRMLSFIKRLPKAHQADAVHWACSFIATRKTCGLLKVMSFDDSTDPVIAREVLTRISLVNRLRVLDLDNANEMIDLILNNTARGRFVLDLILRIEKECQAMRRRLRKDAPLKFDGFVEPERLYRRNIYNLVRETLQAKTRPSGDELAKRIDDIAKPLLTVASQDRHPWIRKSMMIISNALSLLLTIGIANAVRKYNTGDFWFFSRTTTSDAVLALDRSIQTSMRWQASKS
ncbi:Uncharacterised protein [Legionella spiritensis]|nr:Uncharacterised protein [Legionella spiritensis]